MLVRLLYASRMTQPLDDIAQAQLLKQCRSNNASTGVTGVLLSSRDVFLQVLEGGRHQVSALYNRIACDPRHQGAVILHFEEIEQRQFGSWSMGQVQASKLNPALLLKYLESAELDPFSVPGTATLALLQELVSTAAIAYHH